MQKNNIVHLSYNQKSKNNAIKLLTKQHDNINNNNLKKLLCNNYLEYGKCNYGNKCLYSHSLDEQKIDATRKKAYDILNNYLEYNNIDKSVVTEINENKELQKSLLQLTKTCNECLLKKCPGGYNCKHGTIDDKYLICHNDLTNECLNISCTLIHLSKYDISINNKKKYKNKINNNIVGKLLTEMFFNRKKTDDEMSMTSEISDSSSEESFERINNYLNDSPSDDLYNESIFIFSTK